MKKYIAGTIFNKFTGVLSSVEKHRAVFVRYPTRLESMVFDPSKINVNKGHKYSAGQLNFKINLFTEIKLSLTDKKKDVIEGNRPDLIIHAIELFRSATKIKDCFSISLTKNIDIQHAGLGSSSNVISAVSFALNALYGFPIDSKNYVKYIAQNHVEESNENGKVVLVQSLGGSAIAGFFNGSIQVISGYSSLIYSKDIEDCYDVVFGVPKNFKKFKAENLMEKEINNLDGFIETGEKYAEKIAYRLLHEILPDLNDNKLDSAGSLIFDYRFRMNSIKNCSFVYPKMVDIAESLESLYLNKNSIILSISSVGPGFFSISKGNKNKEKIKEAMQKNNLSINCFKLFNDSAQFFYEK